MNSKKKVKKNKIEKILLMIFFSFLISSFVFGFEQDIEVKQNNNKNYNISLNQETILKGYTIEAFEDSFKMSLIPGILSSSTKVKIVELNEPIPLPWALDKISDIYQFEFINKNSYDNHQPFHVQISYDKSIDDQRIKNYKQAFFYDKNYHSWRPLPTKDYPKEKFVRSLIHLPYARIAIFSYPDVPVSGRASWYAYKKGNFTASPDFPKGSVLRVFNLDEKNEKKVSDFVDVVVNDYGPDRYLHPDRVVDLDKVAFSRIASVGAGIITVDVQPLKIKPDKYGRILGLTKLGATVDPVSSAKSGIIVNEKTGEIIWQKNPTSTLPLASLTKLVAVKTFLNTKPNLEKEVFYKIEDEEYNYKYCSKWESARLKVNDGDILKIKDLIYASLIGSVNNTIETLVRVSGLSRDDFIRKMNENVLSWGANSTKFIEPTGLSPENVSSVLDYAIISKKILEDELISKASILTRYEFFTVNTKKRYRVHNTNALIKINKYHITGSKTGYLDEALHCLMMRVSNSQGSFIVVTLGVENKDKSFMEMEDLVKYSSR